jgi:hypothetical protein
MNKLNWFDWLIGVLLILSLVFFWIIDKPFMKITFGIMIVISIVYSRIRDSIKRGKPKNN